MIKSHIIFLRMCNIALKLKKPACAGVTCLKDGFVKQLGGFYKSQTRVSSKRHLVKAHVKFRVKSLAYYLREKTTEI